MWEPCHSRAAHWTHPRRTDLWKLKRKRCEDLLVGAKNTVIEEWALDLIKDEDSGIVGVGLKSLIKIL